MALEQIDRDKCINCLKCVEVCPMDVLRAVGKVVYPAYPRDCMCCYLCEMACPTDAILVHPRRAWEKPLPW
jgi:NAD-dependent dihydropyrimidine dehydrogenase PreA subunit